MAKIGTMSTAAPVSGATHFATKQVTAPKQRQNQLSVRVGAIKRMTSPVKGVKADKPNNIDNF